VHSDINKDDSAFEFAEKIQASILGQNIYSKELADQTMQIGSELKK
jgi:hypothetical protein